MDDPNKEERLRQRRDNWRRVSQGLTVAEVEQIMGFRFGLDSENEAGRMVYSHHTSDYLPFYLVVDRVAVLQRLLGGAKIQREYFLMQRSERGTQQISLGPPRHSCLIF